MPDNRDDPQISWMTVVAAVTVVGLMAGAMWTISQNEFSNVKETATADRTQTVRDITEIKDTLVAYLTKDEHRAYATGVADQLNGIRLRLVSLEATLTAIQPRLAHDPVEDRTFQAVSAASDKRVDLIQAQIADINRQIAAALIIIDNNTISSRKGTLPP